jgi:hypothetical protein
MLCRCVCKIRSLGSCTVTQSAIIRFFFLFFPFFLFLFLPVDRYRSSTGTGDGVVYTVITGPRWMDTQTRYVSGLAIYSQVRPASPLAPRPLPGPKRYGVSLPASETSRLRRTAARTAPFHWRLLRAGPPPPSSPEHAGGAILAANTQIITRTGFVWGAVHSRKRGILRTGSC